MRRFALVFCIAALFCALPAARAGSGFAAVPSDRLLTNGVSVTAGASPQEYRRFVDERLGGNITYDLYTADGRVEMQTVPVTWKGVPASADIAGDYVLECVPASAGFEAFAVTMHIVPPSMPHIAYAGDAGEDVFLQFLRPVPDAEKIAVLLSENGETWRDTAELPGSFVAAGNASVSGLTKGKTYWFQLVVTGGPMAGRSQPLEFPWYDRMTDYNGGGDRDMGDRAEQHELPKPAGDPVPPPAEPDIVDGEAGSVTNKTAPTNGETRPAAPPSAPADDPVPPRRAGGGIPGGVDSIPDETAPPDSDAAPPAPSVAEEEAPPEPEEQQERQPAPTPAAQDGAAERLHTALSNRRRL